MFKKAAFALIIIFLFSINIYAKDYGSVEIFDFDKEKVVKVIQSNYKIEEEAVKYLNNITGIYPKISPIPKQGHAVKIPLLPAAKIDNKWLNADVDQVIIAFPENEPPFLLVFDNENRLMCYIFKGNVEKLLKLIDYDIKTVQ